MPYNRDCLTNNKIDIDEFFGTYRNWLNRFIFVDKFKNIKIE